MIAGSRAATIARPPRPSGPSGSSTRDTKRCAPGTIAIGASSSPVSVSSTSTKRPRPVDQRLVWNSAGPLPVAFDMPGHVDGLLLGWKPDRNHVPRATWWQPSSESYQRVVRAGEQRGTLGGDDSLVKAT